MKRHWIRINGPLKTSLILLICVKSSLLFSQITVGSDDVKSYILSCQKSDGGFGPVDMDYGDLAWTYPAVYALKILGIKVPMPDSCYTNGGKSFMEKVGWKNGPWYWSLNQKANLYKLMNRTGQLEKGFPGGEQVPLHFTPRNNYVEPRKYNEGAFFDMASLWHLTEAIYLMDGVVENQKEITEFIVHRQSPSGGFDDMLGDWSLPDDSKAHLIVTYNAVRTLMALNVSVPNKKKVIEWIQSCQADDGGFRWSPDNDSYSNESDVWYTWAAVTLLKIFGESPEDRLACLAWLNSLQNPDGGFGDRPGWRSRLYSTFYVVQSIEMLTGNVRKEISEKEVKVDDAKISENTYSIYQAHQKSPSGGTEMVDSIAGMKLNLIAVKTKEKEVIEGGGVSSVVKNAREYAAQKGYKLEIVDCPENYAHRLTWFTGMKGNHCSNWLIPPNMSERKRKINLKAYNEGLKEYPWNFFKEKVIQPMLVMGTLFYPELDYTMMNAYMVYDEGLDNHTGYNAVPAAHFNNIDWLRHFPYKERWLGQLPMIADGDAHGDIEEWKHNLNTFRNVYIAKSYHFADYIDASLNGRSVCVIRMPGTNAMRYYGSDMAIQYLKEHLNEWKWW